MNEVKNNGIEDDRFLLVESCIVLEIHWLIIISRLNSLDD